MATLVADSSLACGDPVCGLVVLLNAAVTGEDYSGHLRHRGPDDSGRVVVGNGNWRADMQFRRLSILDLDHRSNQPFGDARGKLTFNGEIYNYLELRKKLSARGIAFRTTGDTEVLFELLLQPDYPELLTAIEGMYSFVFISSAGIIRYARDQFGVKPLYMAVDAGGAAVAFASELSPLLAAGLGGGPDESAIHAVMLLLYTPPPKTGWRSIRAVAPGVLGTFDARTPSDMIETPIPLPRPAHRPLELVIDEAIRLQERADVAVGILYSGGLDSTWIALNAARHGFRGTHVIARETDRDEEAEPFEADAPYAVAECRKYGWDHVLVDSGSNTIRMLPEVCTAMELPLGDPAAATLLALSRQIRTFAPVALSGVGVEELFLGYARYKAIKGLAHIPAQSRHVAVQAASRVVGREHARRLRWLAENPTHEWPWRAQAYLSDREFMEATNGQSVQTVVAGHVAIAEAELAAGSSLLDATRRTDLGMFLPHLNLLYADRASMHASVELRVPFLGQSVGAWALATPAEKHLSLKTSKKLFRRAAATAGVSEAVLNRRKTGFGAPVRSVLRRHGVDVLGRIDSSGAVKGAPFDLAPIRRIALQHAEGTDPRGMVLFGVISACVWWDTYVSKTGSVAEILTSL